MVSSSSDEICVLSSSDPGVVNPDPADLQLRMVLVPPISGNGGLGFYKWASDLTHTYLYTYTYLYYIVPVPEF